MNMELIAAQQMRGMGFDVQKLPTSEMKSPDFLVDSSKDRYLIELKTKFPSEKIQKNHDEQLYKDGHSTFTTILERENRISGVIHGAARQLESYNEQIAQFRLVLTFPQ